MAGWWDGFGNQHFTDPNSADSDGDGLTDGEEAGAAACAVFCPGGRRSRARVEGMNTMTFQCRYSGARVFVPNLRVLQLPSSGDCDGVGRSGLGSGRPERMRRSDRALQQGPLHPNR